jgi:hypothetical protein
MTPTVRPSGVWPNAIVDGSYTATIQQTTSHLAQAPCPRGPAHPPPTRSPRHLRQNQFLCARVRTGLRFRLAAIGTPFPIRALFLPPADYAWISNVCLFHIAIAPSRLPTDRPKDRTLLTPRLHEAIMIYSDRSTCNT